MILDHRPMLEDRLRCESYRSAIEEVVRPGAVVADIGTGSGLLAMFAARAGARKVYAIERTGVIETARVLAEANGLIDRIEFIRGTSTHVDLPEKVDVVVSEILGSFAIEEGVVKYLRDARTRFLKESGVLVPARLEMAIAPVEAEAARRHVVDFWASRPYGIDLGAVRESMLNRCYFFPLGREHLLAEPETIHAVDFRAVAEDAISFERSLTLETLRSGTVHGIAGWFRAHLSPGVSFSTLDRRTHWRVAFFPLAEPLTVREGERVAVEVAAMPLLSRTIWSWALRTEDGRQCLQSNRDEESAVRSALDCVPTPDPERTETLRFVLDACDGRRSVGEIADRLRAAHPDAFCDATEAVRRVVDVVKGNDIPRTGD